MAYRIFLGILLAVLFIGLAVLVYGLMFPTTLPRLSWGILHAARWLCHG